jgi:hypothetical protein
MPSTSSRTPFTASRRRLRLGALTHATSTPFDGAMAEFAESHADQNERDHRALLDAMESGRVAAEIGR